jgi:hypothetical protein
MRAGRWLSARRCFERGIALAEESAIAHPDRSTILAALQASAALNHQLQQFPTALTQWQRAITISPNSASLHNNLGQTLAALDRPDEALAATLQALALDPNYAIAHRNLGLLLHQMGQGRSAAQALTRAISLAPTARLTDYNDLSVAHLAGQQPRMALRALLAGLQQQPTAKLFLETLLEPTSASQEAVSPLVGFDSDDERIVRAWLDWEKTTVSLAEALVQLLRETPTPLNLAENRSDKPTANPVEDKALMRLGEVCYALSRIGTARRDETSARQWQQWGIACKNAVLEATSGTARSPVTIDAMPLTPPDSLAHSVSRPLRLQWRSRNWLRSHHLQNYYKDLSPVPPIAQALTPPLAPEPDRCRGVNCDACWQRIRAALNPQPLGHNLDYFAPPTQIENDGLEDGWRSFVADIPQGRAWAMPDRHWRHTCEAIATITPDDRLLADLSREYEGTLAGCPQWRDRCTTHRLFQRPPQTEPMEIPGTVAAMPTLSPNVYFHWLIDFVPRVELLWRSGRSPDDIDYFWVGGTQRRFQRETLQALGIPLEKCRDSNQLNYVRADRLVVPSFTSALGWASPAVVRSLRQRFLPWAAQRSQRETFPKRIYITRRHAHYRRLVNEVELLPVLEQAGFVTVALESLSLAEQIQLFASVEAVIAPHGAGLTNLVFAPPGAIAIELISPDYRRYYYPTIARHVGLHHYMLMGRGLGLPLLGQLLYGSAIAEDFWIDPHSVKTLLQQLELYG